MVQIHPPRPLHLERAEEIAVARLVLHQALFESEGTAAYKPLAYEFLWQVSQEVLA